MAQHTQGPWQVNSGAVFSEKGAPIATMVRNETATAAGIYPVERDKNAHLIAAAPDLLAACEEALSKMQEFKMLKPENFLTRAINKAKGC